MIRIGSGLDIHKLIDGSYLILAGVKIPCDKSFLAHSDGDLVVHALCDALLGATGLKDIGSYFPDNSAENKDINSLKKILPVVWEMVKRENWSIVNIDINIILDKPKLSEFIDEMKKNIADVLDMSSSLISIKAKTTEKCVFIDDCQAAMAFVTLLLEQ